MFRIVNPQEKHTENHMNYHTETPNRATSIEFEAQSLLQSHTDRMELFHLSKILKKSQG